MVPFTVPDQLQCVRYNGGGGGGGGGDPAREGPLFWGIPTSKLSRLGRKIWVVVEVCVRMCWGGDPAALFWVWGGGEGHMDVLGVKRHAQRQLDTSLRCTQW